MATVMINKSRTKKTAPVVDKNMKSYADDPFFVKKDKDAKALIKKYGVPKVK